MLTPSHTSASPYAEGEATAPPTGPQRLGPYRLYRELASGGMASVHLAKAAAPGGSSRFVALKRIHPQLSCDPMFVEMFSDEARIASLIQHPNVCGVVDFDCTGGEHYLAMEFLVGEPLSAVFGAMVLHSHEENRTPSRAALVARIIADACEGLHAAHELKDPSGSPLNVVHRDVSPQNLFLTYDGVVKVVDFGVARAAHQEHLTVPGVIKGKLAYMPPEVLRGALPDRRADVWAIGCVLWELLTGMRLFHRATDIDTLTRLTDGHVPPPSEVVQDVPPDFDAIIARALAWNPEARYATTREMAKDLTLALARRGDAVGLAELSEWMEELFPFGAVRKREMLEAAVAMDHGLPLEDDAPSSAEPVRGRAATMRPPPSNASSGERLTSHDQYSPFPDSGPAVGLFGTSREPDDLPVAHSLPSRRPDSFRGGFQPRTIAFTAALCVAAFTVALVHARSESADAAQTTARTSPVPRELLRMTTGNEHVEGAGWPRSYAVELEPSREEPGAFVLRLRSSTAQCTRSP